MAAIRMPVPSAALLRFLRSQSENLSFFNPSHGFLPPAAHGIASSPRNPLCAARRNPRSLPVAPLPSEQEGTALQAGMLDINALLPARTSRNPRIIVRTSSTDYDPDRAFAAKGSVRRASSGSPTWKERVWGSSRRGKPLEPDDLPDSDRDGEYNSMFNTRRQLSQKAALEPRLRCTEVDEAGNVVLVDGEFKKSELIARFGLLPRDLRKIDSSNLPHILVRPTAILINLLHLKVLIKYNRVLLFDVYGTKASYPQSAFMYDLQGKLQQKTQVSNGGLPYEFRALEAVLQSATQELEADFEAVREPVIRILSDLEDDIDRHKLRILLILSKRVSTFEQKAKLVRDALEELLEADDDLASMYLTEKTHDLYRDQHDHTEVEMLLESYHKLCDEVAQEAQNLVSGIRNTEEIIRAILDANRNALMLLDLKFSVGTLGLAMGTFIAGLYGMNLENFIEETNWGMGAVTAVSVILSLWVCRAGLIKLRKVQTVRMHGDERTAGASFRRLGNTNSQSSPCGPSGGSDYNWFHDEGHAGLLDPRNREKLRRMNMAKGDNKTPKKKWLGLL